MVITKEFVGLIAPNAACSDRKDVIAGANELPFGLPRHVLSNTLSRPTRAYEGLEFGLFGIKEMLLAATSEFKESGIEREGRSLDIREYIDPTQIKINHRE